MPQSSPTGIYPTHQTRDALLAIGAGGGVAGLAWAILTRPHESIAWYFIGESVPKGGGSNIVNVILVDFRGFDTFGEIIVLGIAGIGVMLLMDGLSVQPAAATRRHDPLLLSVAARVLLPFALLVSVFIFLRGHNLPGGGFIAGLITAVALIIQYMADGMAATSRRLGNDVSPVIGLGVLIAGLTGIASWLFGAPFLTSTHAYLPLPLIGTVPLASAIAFDLGVYLTVVGATLLILTRLGAAARQGATLAGEGA